MKGAFACFEDGAPYPAFVVHFLVELGEMDKSTWGETAHDDFNEEDFLFVKKRSRFD